MRLSKGHEVRIIRPDSRDSKGVVIAFRHLMAEIYKFRSNIRIVFKE